MSLGQVPLIGLVPGMVCPPGAQCFPLVIASGTSTNEATGVTFTDLSSLRGPYSVGDQWTLEITGSPNTAVTGSASQNGAASSSSSMGTTDATGKLTLTGTFGAGDVGNWQESYQVGSGSPASLSFTVQAPPAPASTPAAASPVATPAVAVNAPGLNLSFLTNDIGPLPLWAWLAGGLVALIVVKK